MRAVALTCLALLALACGSRTSACPGEHCNTSSTFRPTSDDACVGDACEAPGEPCTLDGESYPSGSDGIPTSDSCNTCSCDNGVVSCTTLDCVNGCDVDGEFYPGGSRDIPEPGGCGTCRCDGGELLCEADECPQTLCIPECFEGDCDPYVCSDGPCLTGECGEPGACVLDGVAYTDGTSDIPDPDGCGTCLCLESILYCADDCELPPEPSSCDVGGVLYSSGSTGIPSPDFCGTCACQDGALDCLADLDCPEVNCETAADCSPGAYCEKPLGECSNVGQCQVLPSACEPALVCGCDGQEYDSICAAWASGTSLFNFGACDGSCVTSAQCEEENFCYVEDNSCGSRGICEPRPGDCTDNSRPFCGCDGMTYGSRCEANASGFSVIGVGTCESRQ